ncbi:MAG TPA: thioredoxin domain-containing protein, partial [Polyangiaceae bacterium]|nr:thioredoxin domain-containing protein [Polyangiaceae bacterium]
MHNRGWPLVGRWQGAACERGAAWRRVLRQSAAYPVLGLALLAGAACRSPADSPKEPPPKAEEPATPTQLPGVDISALTTREQTRWREFVTELLAPCPDQPVSIAQCVTESRACGTCLPAAKFLVDRVRRGDTRTQAEEAFRTRFSPEAVKSIDLTGSPSKGATSPVVTLVEWADFECPYCGVAAPLLKATVEKHPGEVQLVFKHYPLSAHEHSEEAARAAVAAFHQGKFWQLQQVLFESQKAGLDETTLLKLAREQGLDMKAFETDRASEATADIVARDRKQADELGLDGTPMIFVNGRHFKLDHFDLRQDLEPWIELEIALNSSARPA